MQKSKLFDGILSELNDRNAPRVGVAIDPQKTSPLIRVLMIYGGLVNELEQLATDIELEKMNESFEKRNWERLIESTTTNLEQQKSVINCYSLDLKKLSGSISQDEKIYGATLHILDGLRDRAIKAMRIIGNFINNTTENHERNDLTNYINLIRTVINESLSILKIHPMLANDSSFQNIEEADIVPESKDIKTIYSKDRFNEVENVRKYI